MNLLSCTVFDLISSLIKGLIPIYRCHKLQILQSEGYVASSHRLKGAPRQNIEHFLKKFILEKLGIAEMK